MWSPNELHKDHEVFERFTDRARASVIAAQEVARRDQHAVVDPGHLLIGLIAGRGVAAEVLSSVTTSLRELAESVSTRLGTGPGVPSGFLSFSPPARHALELSLRESLQLRHTWICTGHILLALLRDEAALPAQHLVALGLSLPSLRVSLVESTTLWAYSTEGPFETPSAATRDQRQSSGEGFDQPARPTDLPVRDPRPPSLHGTTVALVIERESEPEPVDLVRLTTASERLLGLATFSMHQGDWADTAPGVEEDVQHTIVALQAELYPQVERPINTTLVEGFALRLAGQLSALQQLKANAADEIRDVLLEVDHGLLEPAMRAQQAQDPSEPAAQAADWIAEHTDWEDIGAPDWLPSQSAFEDFVDAAARRPVLGDSCAPRLDRACGAARRQGAADFRDR